MLYKEQFKTPIDNNSCDRYIIIIDPKHPLFNRKLKLLDVCYKPIIGKCCAVVVGNFIKYISYDSTSLNKKFLPNQTYLCINSLKALIEAYNQIIKNLGGEYERRDIVKKGMESHREK